MLSISLSSGVFYYCAAMKSGLGLKRWTFAGVCFGPVAWPMFCMQKRMKVYRKFGVNNLIWQA